VNVGCVPKKVMFNASHVFQIIKEAGQFGIDVGEPKFHWEKLKLYRDRYIQRLNTIYEGGLDKLGVERVHGYASLIDKNAVSVDGRIVEGKHVLIAVGGAPAPLGVPGEEHCLNSDGFFSLEHQPQKVAIIGAGYIAVELAGVLHGLGTATSLFCRGDTVLRTFDSMVSSHLMNEMQSAGVMVHTFANSSAIVKEEDGTLSLCLEDQSVRFTILILRIALRAQVSSEDYLVA
jgi:glutathione reductase (NADPH)